MRMGNKGRMQNLDESNQRIVILKNKKILSIVVFPENWEVLYFLNKYNWY